MEQRRMSTGVALIPARGGSRRIPRKNVRPFLGVPAIARVIATVIASGVADRVLVSTDDEEIAGVARDAGAEVPSLRPTQLADDHATTAHVIHHAITTWLAMLDLDSPLLVAYPTALLLTPETLRAASDRFSASDADFLLPVLRYPHPVERRLRIDQFGLLLPDEPEHLHTRTQDLEPAYHDAGQFYLGRVSAWLSSSSPLSAGRSLSFELGLDEAVDIDDPADWDRAEALARLRERSGKSRLEP